MNLPPSSLLGRLEAFLPEIEKANQTTEKLAREGKLEVLDNNLEVAGTNEPTEEAEEADEEVAAEGVGHDNDDAEPGAAPSTRTVQLVSAGIMYRRYQCRDHLWNVDKVKGAAHEASDETTPTHEHGLDPRALCCCCCSKALYRNQGMIQASQRSFSRSRCPIAGHRSRACDRPQNMDLAQAFSPLVLRSPCSSIYPCITGFPFKWSPRVVGRNRASCRPFP